MPNGCSPIVKWVGGKRQLIPELVKIIPEKFNTYYEPFLGGGALFFFLAPNKAVLNDFNPQLINLYSQIKTSPKAVMDALDIYQSSYNNCETSDEKKDFYFELRAKFNQKINGNIHDVEEAALLVFLNKAGFNGLYRVNSEGKFNVPSANRTKLNLYDKDNFLQASKFLQKAKITCGDFEVICQKAKRKDLVFFDSPYYGTFDTYQSGGFNEEDHKRLAKLFDELTQKQVYCILTNSNTDFIKDLYSKYTIKIVPVKRAINSDGSNRTGQEIIVSNF